MRDQLVVIEGERSFRSLADSSPMLVWVTGPDKRVIFFNLTWMRFTGRTLEQELGHGWLDGVHADDREHCREIWYAAADARQPVEIEYRLRRHDGEYRWVIDRGTPRFAENGEYLGYIGLRARHPRPQAGRGEQPRPCARSAFGHHGRAFCRSCS